MYSRFLRLFIVGFVTCALASFTVLAQGNSQGKGKGKGHDKHKDHDDQAEVYVKYGFQPRDREIMRNQKYARLHLVHELAHKPENLSLSCDVECRRRLIRDEESRFLRQRHRNHDPLSHSSGQFERVSVQYLLGVGPTCPWYFEPSPSEP